jgi:CheY-like chemotaxis protein
MEEIIRWLRSVERLANEVYSEAAALLSADEEFSSFMHRLAEDEELHFQIMGSASEYLLELEQQPVSEITVDKFTREQVEIPMGDLKNLMKSQTITKQDVVNCIAKAELSEWNRVFLYVIRTFQRYSRTFEYAAAVMQAHEKRLRIFLEHLPDDIQVPDEVREFPHIWKFRILIVEDDKPLRNLFEEVLKRIGSVETASNGQEALEKTREHFFNVIISDIDMPVMNGIQFYKRAAEFDPSIGRYFIFASGTVNSDTEGFFHEHDLRYLVKPFALKRLFETVQEVADKSL